MDSTNTERQYNFQKDLRTLVSMAERLEAYVRDDEIYGNQGSFAGLIAVTIGGILMRIRRLNALREFIGKSKQAALDLVIQKHESVYQEWTVHYEQKILAEAHSRIDRIAQFIEEYHDDGYTTIIAFEPERMRRTILQEILYMMQRINLQDDALMKKIDTTDERLRAIVVDAPFQWHPKLETVYSPDEFWWLYSELQLQPTVIED